MSIFLKSGIIFQWRSDCRVEYGNIVYEMNCIVAVKFPNNLSGRFDVNAYVCRISLNKLGCDLYRLMI